MTANEAPALARDQLETAFKVARRMLNHALGGLVAVTIGVGVTFGVIKLKPSHYVSEAVLHYDPGIQWGEGGESPRALGQRLKDTALARPRLQEIIRELGLYPKLLSAGRFDEAIEEMRRSAAFRVNDGGTFVVSFTADSPEDARRVTARLAEIAIRYNAQTSSQQVEVTKGFLDGERKQAEAQLRSKEAELASFLGHHPEFLQERRRSENATVPPGETLRAAPPPVAVSRAGVPPPDALADLRAAERQAQASLDAARRELALQRSRFTEKHPAVASAADLAAQAEAAHQRSAEALRVALRDMPAAEGQSPSAVPGPTRVAAAQSPGKIAEAEAEFARLTRGVSEERERLQKLDARQFMASMAASSVTTGNGAHVELIDPPYTPSQPSGTRPAVLLLFGIVSSLALGAGVAFALAMLDDRVYDRQDVEKLGLAPLLVEISPVSMKRSPGAGAPDGVSIVEDWQPARRALPPAEMLDEVEAWLADRPSRLLPSRGASPPGPASDVSGPSTALAVSIPTFGEAFGQDESDAATASNGVHASAAHAGAWRPGTRVVSEMHERDGLMAASFRVLRHRLIERGGIKTMLVTSPASSEGKTTCALNLALAFCEAGRAKVLLVDANLQRPAIGRLLGLQPREGQLRYDAAQPWGMVEPVTPWLHVATPVSSAFTSFVDAASVQAGLDNLRAGSYDAVIIDGPPVRGSADVNLMTDSVDAILVTMWSRRSHAASLREAVNQISSPKVLGVVLLRS